ncbi:MAG: transglutaminaseTgpA domain-containing protein, partial [Chloroflexota bacterium]
MTERFRLQEGWSTLFLVWAMVFVAGLALVEADLLGGLQVLILIGSVAILAGLALAKSSFSDRTAHLFSLVYGLFLITYLIGRVLPGDLTWQQRVFDLVGRQVEWLRKAFAGGTSRDGLIFVMHTSAIFWLLGYTAAWYTFRKLRIWRVVLPTGLVLLSVIYYYYGPRPLAIFLAIYVVVALLYVAQTHLFTQQRGWQSAAVRYEDSIQFTFLRSGFIAALLAVLIAWSLPTLTASAAVGDALSGVRKPWRSFQDNWTRLFSSLRSYGTGTSDPYQDTLALGGPRSVGDTPIMDVYVPQRLPYAYWQAIAFDTYEDGRWAMTSNDTILHFPDDGPIDTPATQMRQVITQTIYNYLPNSSTLYGVPEVVGSDRQMFVTVEYDESGNSLVGSIQSRYVLREGDVYRVASLFSYADQQSLRQASTSYPDWIQATYLQIPPTITPRTIELAERLTASYDNPFDKAIAVRNFLRQNIVYNDQITAPPPGAEPIDYVLFENQEGYCNYYASAMAIMLRSQGVPARVVGGYAQGEFNEESSSYRVRASNAHTWVEVYFPGYGWIEFEPTASIPVVDRPTSPSSGGDPFETIFPSIAQDESELLNPEDLAELLGEKDLENVSVGDESQPLGDLSTGVRWWQAAGAVVLVGLAAVTLVSVNVVNKRVEADVEKSYGRLGNWARWLGIPFLPAYTPYERAD